MTRAWLLLGLILAFSGTPFRLAEAASDFARSASGADEAGSIAEVDGGVGDDSGETVRAHLASPPIAEAPDGLPTWLAPAAPEPVSLQPRADLTAPRPPGPPGLRLHALIRRFLC